MITLNIKPQGNGFQAYLDDEPLLPHASQQPLVDAARVLLSRGIDPETALTVRHDGKAFDSFEPLPVREWAKWTYAEGRSGPELRPYRPFPATGVPKKDDPPDNPE
jgi:hypothetical protein